MYSVSTRLVYAECVRVRHTFSSEAASLDNSQRYILLTMIAVACLAEMIPNQSNT
jgi:hypothetical protein